MNTQTKEGLRNRSGNSGLKQASLVGTKCTDEMFWLLGMEMFPQCHIKDY